MGEITNSDISTQTQPEQASKNFNPDERIKRNECESQQKEVLGKQEVFYPDKRIENEVTETDINDYVKDLKTHSEYPETIPDKPFGPKNIEKCSPEETGRKRMNFQGRGEGGHGNPEYKGTLRKEWEELHGKAWPRYTENNCPSNRKPGDCYDAHHIKPLCMGGENDASNITPMHADVHYDSKGVHSSDSPYARMNNKLGGA
ncbi:MAG: HNH endonuclease signature motif containing protein [Treponema sp.]